MIFPRVCRLLCAGCGVLHGARGLTRIWGRSETIYPGLKLLRSKGVEVLKGPVGANGGEGGEEAEDSGEIALGEGGELAAGFGFDVFVDALELEQVCGIDVDEEAAAIVRVGLAADVAAFFEAVERNGDASAGEAGGSGQAGRR